MRRVSFFFLLALLPLALPAQSVMTIDQIQQTWTARSISGVQGGDILSLIRGLSDAMPSKSLIRLLLHVDEQHLECEDIVDVDVKNGYVSMQEGLMCGNGPDETDLMVSNAPEAESVQACVWKRTNGHRLLAVAFRQMSSACKTLLCFYDYDPAKRVLTPEKSLEHLFKPLFSTMSAEIALPKEGRQLVITEDFPGTYCPVVHRYDWDGMKPSVERVSFGNMEKLVNLYKEFCMNVEEPYMTEYALYDVDEDGIPELFLKGSTSYDTYIGAYAMNDGKAELLCGQDEKLMLSFYRHALGYSGHGGAATMLSGYILVKNSRKAGQLVDIQEWDNSLEDFGPSYYLMDGSDMPAAEAEKIIRSIGATIDPVLEWHDIYYPDEQ